MLSYLEFQVNESWIVTSLQIVCRGIEFWDRRSINATEAEVMTETQWWCIIAALGVGDCREWISGLKHLMKEYPDVPYIIRLERFLRTEFYSMENRENK